MEVDRHADRALYLQLADVIRDDISTGRLQPGQRLPSESALIERHGVSRGTAREAIGTLRGEGLVVVEHGRGAFVRSSEMETLTRRVSPSGAFKCARTLFEEQADGAEQAVSIRDIPSMADSSQPPSMDSLALSSIKPAPEAWLGFADGRPITLTRTWRPRTGRSEGDRVEERISARMPTRSERRLLQLDDGSPVLELVRHLRAGEQTVEIALSLVAAERQTLLYYFGDGEHS